MTGNPSHVHASRRIPAAAEQASLLALRVLVGVFLIWGVHDNLLSAERMQEFESFLALHDFPWPALCARVSVGAQLLCGVAFLTGMGFRVAGLVCAINFVVAVVMVDYKLGFRGAFPASMLVLVGLDFAARGPGVLTLPALLRKAHPAA